MKITKIDIMLVNLDCPDNVGWEPIVCRVYTDEGIYGDGEAALAYGRASRAAFGMLQDLSGLLIGRDPLDHEVIWEKLYKSIFWGQNGGPVVFAGISALDIALWDIKGKYFGVPVYKLLGGKMRDSLRCYASQLQFGWEIRRFLHLPSKIMYAMPKPLLRKDTMPSRSTSSPLRRTGIVSTLRRRPDSSLRPS